MIIKTVFLIAPSVNDSSIFSAANAVAPWQLALPICLQKDEENHFLKMI